MAEEAVIKVTVDAEPARKSVAGLRKELKSLIDQQANVAQGGKLWKALAKEINEVEGQIGDLTDSFRTLQGSGVDRVKTSIGLLKEGFSSLDFGKIGVALKGLGSAFKAVIPFALVEGVMYLVENFDRLSKGSGFLAKALRFVGDVIDSIGNAINKFTDMIGLTNTKLDEQGEAIKDNADKAKEAMDAQIAAYDRQIKAAQAAGKSTVELEKAKQQAIIDTNLQVVKQIEAFVRAGGELDDEKKKLLTASLESIRNAKNEENVIEIKSEQDKKKRNEEAFKRLQEKHEKERAELQKQQELALKAAKDEEAWQEASLKYLTDKEALAAQQKIEYAEQEANAKASIFNDTVVAGAKAYDEDAKNFKLAQESKQAALNESLNIAKGVSDVFFQLENNKLTAETNRINKALQNDKLTGQQKYALQLELYNKETAVKKKQFEIDKAFRVAQAVQDGIAASTKALAQFGGVPTGVPFAIATGALAAANVAKILATKFDAGVSPAPPSSDAGGSVSIPSTGAPVLNSNAPTTQPVTTFDEQGRNQQFGQRVYVLESDITKSQNRVARLEEQSTI